LCVMPNAGQRVTGAKIKAATASSNGKLAIVCIISVIALFCSK